MNINNIQGRYLSDVFLIEFPPHVQIFNNSFVNQGPKNNTDYATFIHEYWHFLLNISTAIRFRDFSIWHQFIPIFSKTLLEEANGTALSSNLTKDDLTLLSELTEFHIINNDSGFENLKGKDIKDLKVVDDVIIEDTNLTLKGKKLPLRRVKVPVEVITEIGIEQTNFKLSNNIIDESIANSVERMCFDDGIPPSIVPYLFLSKLSAYYNNGIPLSNIEIASIGTLSFLTTNPSLSVVNIFKKIINLKKLNYSIELALNIIINEIMPSFEEISKVLLYDLQSIENVYKNREPAAQAIEFVAKKIRIAIDLRLENLLFDLEPFKNGIFNREKLETLMFELIPPCDVRQISIGDPDKIQRDLLVTFDATTINLSGNEVPSSYFLQVLNCQLDYFKSHWALYYLIDSKIASSVCPYYTTCNLDFRKSNSQICKTKPWESYKPGKENCMYGNAVASLIGEVKIIKKG